MCVSFSNEDRVEATVVGKDDSTDTALLKVTVSADALRPLALGTSTSVDVGDPVVAIGNPFGLDRTITSGIVSAVARQIEAPERLPHQQRDPDRRRDQPRQLGRPAARTCRAR